MSDCNHDWEHYEIRFNYGTQYEKECRKCGEVEVDE